MSESSPSEHCDESFISAINRKAQESAAAMEEADRKLETLERFQISAEAEACGWTDAQIQEIVDNYLRHR